MSRNITPAPRPMISLKGASQKTLRQRHDAGAQAWATYVQDVCEFALRGKLPAWTLVAAIYNRPSQLSFFERNDVFGNFAEEQDCERRLIPCKANAEV